MASGSRSRSGRLKRGVSSISSRINRERVTAEAVEQASSTQDSPGGRRKYPLCTQKAPVPRPNKGRATDQGGEVRPSRMN